MNFTFRREGAFRIPFLASELQSFYFCCFCKMTFLKITLASVINLLDSLPQLYLNNLFSLLLLSLFSLVWIQLPVISSQCWTVYWKQLLFVRLETSHIVLVLQTLFSWWPLALTWKLDPVEPSTSCGYCS